MVKRKCDRCGKRHPLEAFISIKDRNHINRVCHYCNGTKGWDRHPKTVVCGWQEIGEIGVESLPQEVDYSKTIRPEDFSW